MDTGKWDDPMVDGTPRAEGSLSYIPASDAGLLVYFGGFETNDNGTIENVSLTYFSTRYFC